MRALILALFVLAGCAWTNYTETPTEVRFTYGEGGLLVKLREHYLPFMDDDRRMVLDGPMISASAFYAFALPNVCYTRRIVWSPHATSAGGQYRLGTVTDMVARMLPPPMEAWFRASPYYWDFVGVPEVRYNEMVRIWPEGACERQDANGG